MLTRLPPTHAHIANSQRCPTSTTRTVTALRETFMLRRPKRVTNPYIKILTTGKLHFSVNA